MKSIFKLFALVAFLIVSITVTFAQSLPADASVSIDWVTLVGQLIANPKALTAAFIGALVVLVIIQGMKSETVGKFFKFIPPRAQFLVITVLGLVYSILVNVYVIKDQEISKVLVGFLSSGGAAALFMGIKLCFPKWFESSKAPVQV